MPFILQTNGLTKKIGSKTLVTDVNIHIPKGEIYGFLGLILSILVDTFISKISLTMQPGPKIDSISGA